MHESLRRGLAALEAVAAGHGSAAELGAILAVDKSTVSRLLATLEADSWVVREGGGPSQARGWQCSACAARTPGRSAGPGRSSMPSPAPPASTRWPPCWWAPLASCWPPRRASGIMDYPPIVGTFPILTTATGHALASMLDHEAVTALLVDTPRRVELRRRIAEVRETGRAIEYGEFDPAVGCVAVPWTHPPGGRPSALGCIGPRETIRSRRQLVESALRAALPPRYPGVVCCACEPAALSAR